MDELERLIISLVGDSTQYEQMLNDAITATSGTVDIIAAQASVAAQALERQATTAGMSGREMAIYSMQLRGAGAEQTALAEAINQELSARERQASLYAQGAQLTQQVRTAAEVYKDRLSELKILLESGSISQQTFNRAVQQANQSMRSSSATASAMRAGMAGVHSISSTTASIIGAAGLSFGLLATAIKGVQLAGASERTLIDLETFMGSAEVAKKTIADLAAFSERTPLRMSSLIDATKMMSQMGLAAEDVVPMMKLLGDAAGGNSERLQTMAMIMGRIISTGHITGHEIRMLTMAGFNPMKDMAAATGKSVADLTAQLHRGGVTADLLIRAFQHAGEAGGTFAGRSEKQATSLLGLYSTMQDQIAKITRTIGETIVEGLNLKGAESNIIEAARMIVTWLKGISDESKRVIGIVLSVAAAIGVTSFALFALGPVFSLLGTVLGPVIAMLGVIPTLFAFMLTPIGAVTAAIAGLYAVTLYYAGGGGLLMDWFGKQFEALKTHVEPAIKGIKDAILAGDLQLAFEIAWVQIRLSFITGLLPLREAWEDYIFFFKNAWANASYDIQKNWQNTTTKIAIDMATLGEKLGIYTAENAKTMREGMKFDLQLEFDKLKMQHEKAIGDAMASYNKAMQGIDKDTTELQKKRDELLAKAKEEAAKGHPMPVVPKLDPNKFKPPDQKMKVTPVVHWEAALAEGAEALSRVMAYQAGIQGLGPGLGGTGHGAHGGPGGVEGPASGVAVGEDAGRDKMIGLLGEIADHTGISAKKPTVEVTAADL